MVEKRIEWLDFAKGLGMLFIMIGHAKPQSILSIELYTFHVPLFFFLSGYIFNYKKYNSIKLLYDNKVRTLIIPYFVFSSISYIYFIFDYASNHNYTFNIISSNILIPLIRIITAYGCGPLWFIACLIVCEFIFLIILRYSLNEKRLCALLFICSAIGYLYARIIDILLPWAIDTAFSAIVFYGLGYLFNKHIESIQNFISWKIASVALLVNVASGYFNLKYIPFIGHVDMIFNSYGNYFLFYISSCSGIFAVVSFCMLAKINNMLRRPFIYIGQNSFIFLAFHETIIYPLIEHICMNLLRAGIVLPMEEGIFATAKVLGTTLLLYPVTFVINSYFPYVLGRGSKFRRVSYEIEPGQP